MRKSSLLAVAMGFVAGGLVVGGGVLTPGAASASSTAAPACSSAMLKVTVGRSQGTAGTIYYPIIFTNQSGSTCSIYGVPMIQPVGVGRISIGPVARNTSRGEMPASHTLKTGQSVSVAFGVIETGNYTPSTCVAKAARGAVVSMGSFLHNRYVHLNMLVCTKRASTTTHLITAGVTGE
ncbi:MAG: DUF4232 domain-containing protein [Acidimicrobiales bacterium]